MRRFVTPSAAGLVLGGGSLRGTQRTTSSIDAPTSKRALVPTMVLLAVVLLAALVARGQSKPTGSDYLGKWEGTIDSLTGGDGPCHLEISSLGVSFVMKSVRQTIGNCVHYEGVFTLTPEGNLKGGQMGELLISFDKAKNQAVVSGMGKLRYLTKAQIAANEAEAASLLRTIATANTSYAATYNIGFAGTLAQLYPPSAGCPVTSSACADLITLAVSGVNPAAASPVKSGYTFTYSAPGAAPRATFSVVATPVAPGSSGNSTFCLDQTLVVKKDPTGNAVVGAAGGCGAFAGDPM